MSIVKKRNNSCILQRPEQNKILEDNNLIIERLRSSQ